MGQKDIIRTFYEAFFNRRQLDAADRWVLPGYIQHNPGVPQRREGLKAAFQDKFTREPDFRLEIDMIIEECDRVVVYLHALHPDGAIRADVVDIYRFEEGMLAEHWDVISPR